MMKNDVVMIWEHIRKWMSGGASLLGGNGGRAWVTLSGVIWWMIS